MFYKFGDKTKTKTIVKKSEIREEKIEESNQEIFDENDDTNRRSAILKKYKQEETDFLPEEA